MCCIDYHRAFDKVRFKLITPTQCTWYICRIWSSEDIYFWLYCSLIKYGSILWKDYVNLPQVFVMQNPIVRMSSKVDSKDQCRLLWNMFSTFMFSFFNQYQCLSKLSPPHHGTILTFSGHCRSSAVNLNLGSPKELRNCRNIPSNYNRSLIVIPPPTNKLAREKFPLVLQEANLSSSSIKTSVYHFICWYN